MLNVYERINLKGLVLLFAMLGALSVNAKTFSSDKISGFKLSMCTKFECIKMISEKAHMSKLTSAYAFKTVVFKVKKLRDLSEISFIANDVYYDLRINKIMFRDIKENKFKQAIYDLEKSELSYL